MQEIQPEDLDITLKICRATLRKESKSLRKLILQNYLENFDDLISNLHKKFIASVINSLTYQKAIRIKINEEIDCDLAEEIKSLRLLILEKAHWEEYLKPGAGDAALIFQHIYKRFEELGLGGYTENPKNDNPRHVYELLWMDASRKKS